MPKTISPILFLLFSLPFYSFGQNHCGIKVDTANILMDKNLDSFLFRLQTGSFQTFTDKQKIPEAIRYQLNCLTNDTFSLANPDEEYSCCCTSSPTLSRRKLEFFATSYDMFLITYQTGGIGVSTTILMFKLQGDKIIDLWTGYGFPEFKSKDEVIKHIKQKRTKEFGLHSNFISL